jgi:ABC-type nitrate/sulfonate/bicarbonate transport system substrate-binding protein
VNIQIAEAPTTDTASKTAKTTLWYTRCPCATAFSVAWQLGLFRQEFADDAEVEFRSLQQSGDPKVYQSHFSHTQENSFRFGGNIPAIWARSIGSDTRLIGLSWVPTPYSILALPGSGIRSVADLKGKRLLVARRTKERAVDFWRATTLRTYETALATAGLTLSDVVLVDLPIDRLFIDPKVAEGSAHHTLGSALSHRGANREVLFALIRGEADAVVFHSTSSIENAALLGAHVVYDVGRDHPDKVARANNGLPEALTVSGSLLSERPELVARVVGRLLEAGDWAKSHREEAVRFVAREQHAAEEIVEATYGSELYQAFETDLAPDKVAALRSQKDFLLRHGFIEDFDFDSWIDPRPLAEAGRAWRNGPHTRSS